MTVVENITDLDELLDKAKEDVRWIIRDFQFRYTDTLQLEITSIGERGQILIYKKYREDKMDEPCSEYESTMNLRTQKNELEYLLSKQKRKCFLFRNKEAIDAYEDDLRKIEVEMAKLIKQNKADWMIYNLQRKEEKAKLKAFALTVPNIKKGYYEAI